MTYKIQIKNDVMRLVPDFDEADEIPSGFYSDAPQELKDFIKSITLDALYTHAPEEKIRQLFNMLRILGM